MFRPLLFTQALVYFLHPLYNLNFNLVSRAPWFPKLLPLKLLSQFKSSPFNPLWVFQILLQLFQTLKINSTLCPSIFDSLLNYACDTSKQAWDILTSLYLDQGLPPSYRTFVSGLNAKGTIPSFLALRPLLLIEEAHINATDNKDSTSHTALVASAQAPPLSPSPSSNSYHANQYPRKSHNGRGRSGRGGKNLYVEALKGETTTETEATLFLLAPMCMLKVKRGELKFSSIDFLPLGFQGFPLEL
ncbi:hypothetical protein KY290_002200 [Solanum tuberosum]|uniref:Pentatricopeptide repeat-containing protein n=1 Tax=Solanum tuberosum TaxID=4113 RepID=A0ABQ7WPE1_SOLTU|nr:hypothetical protein KY290_002200 [Solanum tuberosum]